MFKDFFFSLFYGKFLFFVYIQADSVIFLFIKIKYNTAFCSFKTNIANHINDDLIEAGVIDSFEIVNVVMELEGALNVEIDPEMINPQTIPFQRSLNIHSSAYSSVNS